MAKHVINDENTWSHIINKELICLGYKMILQINEEKTNNPVETWAKDTEFTEAEMTSNLFWKGLETMRNLDPIRTQNCRCSGPTVKKLDPRE